MKSRLIYHISLLICISFCDKIKLEIYRRYYALENERFKPLVDKLFWIIVIFTSAVMIGLTVAAVFEPVILWGALPADLLVAYFLVSPLFGYVELRVDSVFIKFGFILKREIPYKSIRGVSRERKVYSDSMLTLKNSVEHINIKYNSFDMVSVSVVDNDLLTERLEARRAVCRENSGVTL